MPLILPDDSAGLLANLVPNAKWLAKGLTYVFIGNKCVWSAFAGARPMAPTGGPKLVTGKFGPAVGFGSTYGSGTTDRLDGGVLPRPASGWRSIVAHYYANGTGGGGIAHLFQDVSGNGLQAGEEIQIVTGPFMLYGLYATGAHGAWYTSVGVATGRWQSFGVTHDQRTVNVTPTLWMDGAATTAQISQAASGSYQTTPCNMVWGNRASDNARIWDGILGPSLIFDGALTNADHAVLDRDPLQVFDPDDLAIWLPVSTGGDVALAGAAAAQASASGTLSVQVRLVGAATTVATASGTMTTQVPLGGQAAAVTLASGALSITVSLTGAALANALASGALSTQIALSGSALANALATGNLLAGGSGALAGNAAAKASAAGALSIAVPLQGAASAIAIASGGLTTAVPLAGVAAAVAAATGDLTVTFNGVLSGAAAAQVLAAGTLSIQVPLSGTAIAHALATGYLGNGILFAGSIARSYSVSVERRFLLLEAEPRSFVLTP